MTADPAESLTKDPGQAIEIAERIWWVGAGRGSEQRHAYLIEHGDQSILLNPGSKRAFGDIRRRIEQILPFRHIRWFICLHQDPDVTSALPLIDAAHERDDAGVLAHGRTCGLLHHYGLSLPLVAIETQGWRLASAGRVLEFVFTPYARMAGSVCAFDRPSGVLFSGDLFSAADATTGIEARQTADLDGLAAYHQRYMPSGDALDHALLQIERLPVRLIAPQHGPLIPRPLIRTAIERLRHLKCGVYLLAEREPDMQQVWQLGDTLRRISETMLMYRDFGDIAKQLLVLVQPMLPAEHIEYHAALPDGRVLTLNPETQFVGITEDQPPDVCSFIGKTRAQWVSAHASDPTMRDHRLTGDHFCVQPSGREIPGSDGLIITLPLTARGQNRIEALAVIRVQETIPITGIAARLISRIADPLQVALEREVIYRTLDLERERAYQRSIHDPLTGLFTRVYMQDVVNRQCALHRRDPAATLCACMLDLDHFKAVNDSYGHAAGDRVLATVAAILMSGCRATDVPVRFGGEEMLLFTIGQGIDGASILAERLRTRIAETQINAGGSQDLRVTTSIGIAEHRRDESLDSLIRRADAALYRAKRNGRNRVELAEA